VNHASINSLMDPYFKRWNEPVVRQVFSEDLASKILNTPLFEQIQQDTLIWKAEKNGRYSVRSELVDLSHLHKPGYWDRIWKLKTLLKVKNLIWRMCRDCLPTRVRLLDKGVDCTTQCVSCDSNHEDLSHVFFSALLLFRSGLWQAYGERFKVR